jgi:hypothetical protein
MYLQKVKAIELSEAPDPLPRSLLPPDYTPEKVRALEGHYFMRGVENTNMTDCISSL